MIKLDKDYSDYTDDTDEAYPAGKAIDATTEESIDGTPYLKKWMNNTHGAFTALWVKAFGSVEGMSGKPDSVAHSDVLLAVEKLIDTLIPSGMIMASPLANVANFLPCHGGDVSRIDFPKLNAAMAAIGYPYGDGNGSTTFTLPPFNIQGAFLRGKGGNAGAVGVTPQGDAIRNIIGHVDFSIGVGTHSVSGVFQNLGHLDSRFIGITGTQGLPSAFDFNVAASGVPTANENRPINHAIYWHIKY